MLIADFLFLLLNNRVIICTHWTTKYHTFKQSDLTARISYKQSFNYENELGFNGIYEYLSTICIHRNQVMLLHTFIE